MATKNHIQADITQSGSTSRTYDSGKSRFWTAVFSVSLFTAVGALLGYCLGMVGSSKENRSPPRLMAWIGGLLSGMVALGSQPISTEPERGHATNDAVDLPMANEPVAQMTIPLQKLDTAHLEVQGKVTPEMIREKSV